MLILNSAAATMADLQQLIGQLKRNFDKAVQGPPELSAAERLKAAVKQRLGLGRPVLASAPASNENGGSFSEKLSREIQRQLGHRSQQAARDRADKEKARYRGYKRKPTRSG